MSEARRSVPDLEPWAGPSAQVGSAAIIAIVIVNILNAYAIIAGPWENERDWFLLNQESNPGTWLSVVMLCGAALLAGVCQVVDRRQRRAFWSLVALALLAMSFDEAATVHERVGGNVDSAIDSGSDLTYLWVIPWAALAVVVAVVMWRLRPQLPTSTRNGLLLGAGVAVGAAIGLELLATETVNSSGASDATQLSLYSVEENLEMIGVLIIAYTLARHALAVSRRARTDREHAV